MEVFEEIKTGFKKTKIGWIPDDWETQPLGSIINHTKGFAFKSNEYCKSGTRVIRVSDTNANSIKNDNPIYVNNELNKYGKWKMLENDLVFSTVGSRPPMYDSMVGKVIRIKKEYEGALLNQNAVILRTIVKKIHPIYLFNLFKRKDYLNYIETIFRGNANQVSITLKDLFKYIIPIPPFQEQHKIATILFNWDIGIDNTQKLIELLKLRKIGLMQQLLTGKKRLDGFNKEWNEEKLGDHFTERKETKVENLELLSIGKNGVYPQNNSVKKDISNSNKSKYKRICIGDIGYNTMRMWQGRSALSNLEGIVSPAYTIVTPKDNADSNFFSYLFKLNEMIHKFYRNSQGMVSDTWMCKFKDFSIIKFQAPPTKEEQIAIANVLIAADKEIANYKKYLEQLQSQKKGLMQQLLTGKIRVKVN